MIRRYSPFLFCFIIVAMALFMPTVVSAATWYVGTENAVDNRATHGRSIDMPFASISVAEQAAQDGDTIMIANGTYVLDYLNAQKALTWDGESKDGVILQFTNRARGIYLHNTQGQRVFQNLTLQNNDPNQGPAHLIDLRGREVNTIFDNVKFENGRMGAIIVRAGREGITVQNSEVIANLPNYGYFISAAGGYTVENTTFHIGEDPIMPALFHQYARANGEKVRIHGNTITMENNHFPIRMRSGGYVELEITENIFHLSEHFGRTAIQLKGHSGEVIMGNTLHIPSTQQTAYAITLQSDGTRSIARVEQNVVHIHNNRSYGILIGDEGGRDSHSGAYDGSIIRGNTIYGPGHVGHDLAVMHAIMAGYNKDIIIEDNFVKGAAYCVVAKYNGIAWEAGGIRRNTCIDNKWGIRVKGSSNVSVHNNTITAERGTNITAIAISGNGRQFLAENTQVTENTVTISEGKVYNFRDESDETLSSNRNRFALSGNALMGNLHQGNVHTTLPDWQLGTEHDVDSEDLLAPAPEPAREEPPVVFIITRKVVHDEHGEHITYTPVIINNDEEETDNRLVTLSFFVEGAQEIMISNDWDFADAKRIDYVDHMRWKLDEYGPGDKKVYVRFLYENGGHVDVSDIITLTQ